MIDFTTPDARKLEIVGAGSLIIIILVLAVWYMATHPAPEPFSPLPVASSTPVAAALPPQTIEEHAQYYDVEAVYPAETALKATAGTAADLAAVARMKGFVEETVGEFKLQGNFNNLSPEDIQMMGFSDGRKESLVIEYEEKSGASTVSYVYSIYLDTLGAHPNAFFRTFTFDQKTGASLAIGDLFTPRSDYLKRLSAITRFELDKSLGEFADVDYINQGTTAEALNFQSFAIESNALVIIFPPYQVAPYAAGIQKVSIPLSQLKDILKPAYLP